MRIGKNRPRGRWRFCQAHRSIWDWLSGVRIADLDWHGEGSYRSSIPWTRRMCQPSKAGQSTSGQSKRGPRSTARVAWFVSPPRRGRGRPRARNTAPASGPCHFTSPRKTASAVVTATNRLRSVNCMHRGIPGMNRSVLPLLSRHCHLDYSPGGRERILTVGGPPSPYPSPGGRGDHAGRKSPSAAAA